MHLGHSELHQRQFYHCMFISDSLEKLPDDYLKSLSVTFTFECSSKIKVSEEESKSNVSEKWI